MKIQPGVGYTFDSSSKGFTFDTSEQFPDNPAINYHPFEIYNVSIVAGGVSYKVKTGTMNNLVPVIDDDASGTTVKLDRTTGGVANPPTALLTSVCFNSGTKTSYITLRAGKSSTTNNYPDPDVTSGRYPLVVGGTDPAIADTDTYSYLFIGTITVDDITTPTTFTVNQYVTGSIWANRIKLGTLTATYYYARI
jgi:hypothetical protein